MPSAPAVNLTSPAETTSYRSSAADYPPELLLRRNKKESYLFVHVALSLFRFFTHLSHIPVSLNALASVARLPSPSPSGWHPPSAVAAAVDGGGGGGFVVHRTTMMRGAPHCLAVSSFGRPVTMTRPWA